VITQRKSCLHAGFYYSAQQNACLSCHESCQKCSGPLVSDCWPIIHSVKVLNSNDLIKIIEVDINLDKVNPDTYEEFTINFDKPFSDLPQVLISLIGMKYKSKNKLIKGDSLGVDL